MKNYLSADIKGKGFFKQYILFYIPLVILAVISNRLTNELPLISSLASLVQSYLSILLSLAVVIYAVKFVLYRDKNIAFSGRLGEAAPKMLKWYLLTVITLGIYSPWMIKNMAEYYLNRLNYEGRSGELLSRPGKLLKLMLLTLYLPLIILTVIYTIFMLRSGYYDPYSAPMQMTGLTFIFIIVILLVMIPFLYYYIAWILNIRFGEYRVEFRRSMSELAGFLIPQILLSIITVFIYYPAAVLKIYKFILEGCVYCDENGSEKGDFGFEGSIGRGWALLWGQFLLTVITIGIYAPWAIARVSNWYLNNLRISDNT